MAGLDLLFILGHPLQNPSIGSDLHGTEPPDQRPVNVYIPAQKLAALNCRSEKLIQDLLVHRRVVAETARLSIGKTIDVLRGKRR